MQTYRPMEAATHRLEARLRLRLDLMLDQFTAQPDCSIPQATENRNAMDAAYQFFANHRVTPLAVLDCCLPATRQRIEACPRILALQDTSEFNYSSLEATDGLGYTAGSSVRGLLLHSTLAVTPDGLPLGLLTQQIWARDPDRKGAARKRRQQAALDKESYRWIDHAEAARRGIPAGTSIVHVADREGDLYDWFAAPRPAHAALLVRVAQAHRIVVQGPEGPLARLADVVRAQVPLGTCPLAVPRADDRPARQAVLTVRAVAVQIQPPRNAKQRSKLRPVPVWVVEAVEEGPPNGEKALCWRLVTTEAVTTRDESIRALREYAIRWRIERFHYVLKQGFPVEQLQLKTADRLANAMAVYSQAAVRLLRLTYLARQEPGTPVAEEFTAEEETVLDRCREQQERRPGARVETIAEAVRVIARLGGHLGRTGDGPPGAKVLWRGLQRFHDHVRGFQIARTREVDRPRPGRSKNLSPSEN